MRRFVLLLALAFTGCNRGPDVVSLPPPAPPADPPVASAPPVVAATAFPTPEPSPQDKFDAAVWSAVTLVIDRKYAEAIASLDQAQRIRKTDQLVQEVARIRLDLEAAQSAERAIRGIQTVIADGNPEEAARLSTAAIREFGDSDAADAVVRLKRDADALVSVSLDGPARLARFRHEADEAGRGNQLRAAALACEQCLIAGDATIRPRLTAVQAIIGRYDDARRRAAESCRDRRFEEAIDAFKVAAAAWDTPQTRRDIDHCRFALQYRRERLSVAEFETRGDVGVLRLGQLVAEELLPAFTARYDVVEGGPVAKLCEDLRLRGADLLVQETARRELARLAKVRYLVIGSITRLGGVVVRARLLDLQTGLVMQTAELTAPTSSEVLALLPHLAVMLQMSDDQRLAYEQQLAGQSVAIPVAAEMLTVPPLAPAENSPGPAPVCTTARPPEPGGVTVEDFRKLTPPSRVAAGTKLVSAADNKYRGRALSIALELGDEFFRHERYREARAQFQTAVSLSPGQKEIRARLDRCLPGLPATVEARSVVPSRLAVLDFVAAGPPAVVPPGTGTWAAENVSPYLNPPYDLADRKEVNWYIHRLGITLRDAVEDPNARKYLGRAIDVRFLVLGTVRATPAGLEAVAHLLDTETGLEVNTASALARDRSELKCRLGDIARWLPLDPAERARHEAAAMQAQSLLAEAEAAAKSTNFSAAIELAKKARNKAPGIRVELLLDRFDRQARVAALEAERRTAWEQTQAVAVAVNRRRQELAVAAEAAGAAARQAARVNVEERQQRRDLACQELLVQARVAADGQNLTLALQLYDSVLGIDRKSEAIRERESVQMRAAERGRAQATVDRLARDAALRHERAADLERVRGRIDAERKQQVGAETARPQTPEKPRREPETNAVAQPPVVPKADAEAKRQADLKAKAEVEAEAKRRTDAKAKVEAEARKKAEADAKAKAQADAEARRQADAKAKADADAKARAAEEARRQLEEKAQAVKTPAPMPPSPSNTKAPPLPPPAFVQQMESGAALQKEERYAEALKAYDAALAIVPSDPAAIKNADFVRHMSAGVAALKAGKKADAAREFEAALKAIPDDPAATNGLEQAKTQ